MTLKLPQNLDILKEAVRQILAQEGIDKEGIPFVGGINSEIGLRLTQNEALTAYDSFLEIHENPQRGYFEIPTGIGKTLLFLALTKFAYLEAKSRGIEDFRTTIVVPTTELLKQTKKSIKKYAPELLPHVGLYGGSPKDRDISKAITIITYASWQKMVEQGLLNYENTDLLISDEAHRGLSDRHKGNFFEAFGEETISLGFTATSEFDYDKTVEHTHEQLIYTKDIRTAIRGGELAAYVQAQLVKIRIDPSELSDEFNEEAEGKNTDSYRVRLRQGAWNQYMLGIYKHGIDEHTGDLLNENQAAFFTADTTHADRLEDLLNNDIYLQSIARERGYDGVAVAIHTNGMSSKEQDRRMKAYQAGRYMAVIGDSKFKEGFDHEPLKTIFDFQRGSLVDKAQILGRGARQWFNPKKQRLEGMTLIDSIIYIGHDDPEIDQKIYDAHLKYAVLATSILNGDHVISELEEDRFKNRRKGLGLGSGGLSDIFPDDKNIQIYATQEDLKIILADLDRVNQKRDLIEITDEMRSLLNSEMDRTELGVIRISQLEGCPEDLTSAMIQGWKNYNTSSVVESHWNWVINTLQKTPDAEEKIDFTVDMHKELISEMKRTNVGAQKIYAMEDRPENLSIGILNSWRQHGVSIVNPNLWNWVMAKLKSLPDLQGKIGITEEMREHLKFEMSRTGLGSFRIISMEDCPEGITPSMIEGWKKNVSLVSEYHWNWVINVLKDTKSAGIKIELTKEMRNFLKLEMERTSAGAKKIVTFDGKPKDLTAGMISGWIRGDEVAKVEQSSWDWVINTLREQSDSIKIDLSDEMIEKLEGHIERTGVSPRMLSGKILDNAVKESLIADWRRKRLRTVKQSAWNLVFNAYASLPDRTTNNTISVKSVFNLKSDIDKAQILFSEINRVVIKGSGIATLITKNSSYPEGLSPTMVKRVLDGKTSLVREDHYDFLVDFMSTLPTRIKLTDEHRNALAAHKERTGVGYRKISQMVDGLSVSNIDNWSSGGSTVAEEALWNDLIKAYEGISPK